MDIKGFKCPCSENTVPPTHYEKGECKSPPMPLAWIKSILETQAGDYHKGNVITPTRLLTCPREQAILDNADGGTVLDVTSMNAIHWGNVMHKELERMAHASGYAEVRIPPEGADPPMICGVPIIGKVDIVSKDYKVIGDYKTHSEYAQKWVSNSAKIEDTVQLNFYRIGIAKSVLNVDPREYLPDLVIWHGAMASANGPAPWIRARAKIMTEEEILAVKPKGATRTVADFIQTYQNFHKELKLGVPVQDAIKRMPLDGRPMMRGKKCLMYCLAKGPCDQLEGVMSI